MSEQAFRERIAREESEIPPIEAALKGARDEVSGMEKILAKQHERVREAQTGLREFLDKQTKESG